MATVPEDDLPDSLKGTAVPEDDLPTSPAPAAKVTRQKIVEDLSRPITWNKGQPLYAEGSFTEGLKTAGKFLGGVGEVGASALSGMATLPVAGIAGAGKAIGEMLTGEPYGSAMAKGSDLMNRTMSAGTYQPRTDTGKQIAEVVSAPFQMASRGLGAAGKVVGGPQGEVLGGGALDLALQVLPVGSAARSLKAARSVPPTLTQAQDALMRSRQSGYPVNPADVNPSMANKSMEAIAGRSGVDAELAMKIASVDTQKAKQALGIPGDQPLNTATVGAVEDAAGRVYDKLRRVNVDLTPDPALQNALLNVDSRLHAAKQQYPTLVRDNTLELFRQQIMNPSAPPTMDGVLTVIGQLRADAATILKSQNLNPTERKAAIAHKAVATELEKFVEAKLASNPRTAALMPEFRKARETLAKASDVREVTNLETGYVDAGKLARLKEDGVLSGGLEDIVQGHLARQRPKGVSKADIAASDSTKGQVVAHLLGGAAGSIPGAVMGSPSAAAGGATVGSLMIPAAARKAMASKLYQRYMATKSPDILKQLAEVDPKMAAALAAASVSSTATRLPAPMETPQ